MPPQRTKQQNKDRTVPSTAFKKGRTPWNKGRKDLPKHSTETKLKMSKSRKGIIYSDETRKKMSISSTGRKLSEETKIKIGIKSRLKKHSESTKRRLSNMSKGSKSRWWKGGITLERRKIRNCLEYKLWRKAVFERDNFTCVWCGFKGYIEADHIKSFSQFPELRFAIDNGRTLCKPCHKSTDNYGYKAKTKNYQSE